MTREIDLLSYLPIQMRRFYEMQKIMGAENPEFKLLWDANIRTRNELFIMTAGEWGINRVESIVGVTPADDDSLEARRFRVLTRINEHLPYTYRVLDEQLRALCGEGNYAIRLDSNAYTISVRVALVARNNFDDVAQLLDRVIPANFIIDLQFMYNTYRELSWFTHAYLSGFTHKQMRNERFE